MFSLLNFFTNFRSLALTALCFCGAFLDMFLHYFELWEHRHGYGIYIAVFVAIVITLALVWLFKTHYDEHKKAMEAEREERHIKQSPFIVTHYTEKLWLPPHMETYRRTFKLSDAPEFQQAFDQNGYIAPNVINTVLERWNAESKANNKGTFYYV